MRKLSSPLALAALCVGFFMVIIDVTIVNVALPSIATQLQTSVSGLQWIVDSYTLPFAALLLSAGNLGDRVGAKNSFLYGITLFILTSLACGIASNITLLIIFRFLQGISAALIVPTSLALINATYPDASARAKAIGIWACVSGAGGAAGPILGACLTTWFGWRAIFFVNIPIGIIGILLTVRYVPNPLGNGKSGFDVPGQLLGTLCIAALAFGLITAGAQGWLSNTVVVSFVIFAIALWAFLRVEHRTAAPMLPLSLFRSPTFATAIAVGMILNIGAYGELFVLSLYFQQVREYSVLATGFAFLPLLGIIPMSSYYGGKIISISGPRKPMAIGLGVGALGFCALLMTGAQTPIYAALILPLMAIGFSAAFTMPAATVAAIESAPSGRAGLASGALNASRQVGSLIGVAISGTFISMFPHFITGMHLSLILGALVFIVGGAASLIWIR